MSADTGLNRYSMTTATPDPDDLSPDDSPSSGSSPSAQPTSGVVVSLVISVLVAGLAFGALGEGRAAAIPAAATTGLVFWIAAAIIIIAAGAGAQYAERTAAAAAEAVGQPHRLGAFPSAWAVPAATTFGAVFLIATYHNFWMLFVGPVITFLGIAGSLFARDLLDDVGESATRVAALIHTAVIHAIAFVALGTVYLNKLPDWLGASLIGLVSGVLILETLERADMLPIKRVAYSLLGALVMWQATVAIMWWPTYSWYGGAIMLACFYVVAGILLAWSQRSAVRWRDAVSYGVIGSVAIILALVVS